MAADRERRRPAPGGLHGDAATRDTAFCGPVRHAYVHVPFCRAKCDYCDFASLPVGDAPDGSQLDLYVDGVATEWRLERAAWGVRRLQTLYVGGGTPSLLGPARLQRLLGVFAPYLTRGAEITVEANPEDVDDGFATWAAGSGAGPGARGPSRVSLGVQSFDLALRVGLGRRAVADPGMAFARLRVAGVTDLSVDLMYGLPGQTAADLEDDIAALLRLRPEHVSWYELSLTEGTSLAARLGAPAQGSPESPAVGVRPAAATAHGDELAEMYRRVVDAMVRAGYVWYEVSNFAQPGRRARHNASYWRARPYLGIGPGAVSTVGSRRWRNTPDPAAWGGALMQGTRPEREVEDLDATVRARERLLLAARCGAPVALAEVTAVLDLEAAATLAAAGLVSLRGGTIRVTRKGRYVADEVCVRLFRA